MVEIVLIRPGTTPFDEQGRIQGTLDIPLSERGTDEVERLTSELLSYDINTVYSCPCQSAVDTAEAVADAIDARFKPLEKLRNVSQGLWQGRCLEEVLATQPKVFRQWQTHPQHVCPPEGETLCEAWDRIEATIAKIVKKHEGETIAFVAPEPMASLLRNHLTGDEIGEWWKPAIEGARWEVIQVSQLAPVRA